MKTEKVNQKELTAIKDSSIRDAEEFYKEIGLQNCSNIQNLNNLSELSPKEETSDKLHWTRLSLNSNHGLIIG